MRWAIIIAAVLGAVLALAMPKSTGAGTGRWYDVHPMPPSGPDGQYVLLTCGWHSGACGGTDGDALDWDDKVDLQVRFRGWFLRTVDAVHKLSIVGRTSTLSSGSFVCDEAVANIYENNNGVLKLRFAMHYLHAVGPQWPIVTQFTFITFNDWYWNSIPVATMVWDTGCTGQWYHVHEYPVPIAVATWAENHITVPYVGDYCDPGIPGSCTSYLNNSTSGKNTCGCYGWFRGFVWEEGS